MKKTILASTLLALSFGAAASEYNGHRIGAGISNLTLSDNSSFNVPDWKLGNGIKLEYGYDFNEIVGINVSYTNHSDDVSVPDIEHSVNYKSSSLKVDADIGYAFQLDGFAIKPYGAIGLTSTSEDLDTNSSWGNVYGGYSNLHVGMGVRAQLDMGMYADFRYDLGTYDDIDTDYVSFTVGYRF